MAPGVLVFVQQGCPACHDFLPRFKQAVAPLARAGVPVHVADITKNPRATALADRMKIQVTPTTIIRTRRGQMLKGEGALPIAELSRLLGSI